jgi:hypothetical protein
MGMHAAACMQCTFNSVYSHTFDATAVPYVTPFPSAGKSQKRSGTGVHGLYVVVFADSMIAAVVVAAVVAAVVQYTYAQ